jgi:divalent metal cation (Fe/Co/Zn/Cd) transporter
VRPDVLELPVAPPASARPALVRRARLLAWLSLGWHLVEALIAAAAGLAAGSIALIGFGGDSLIEAGAAGVILWRFSSGHERRAQRLIGASFLLLAAYVSIEAVRTLVLGDHADASPVGIALAAVTLVTMPPLAAAKSRVGAALGSSATASEGRQNLLCAYLSAALLVGLGANALLGWWWADPAAALAVAALALKEGREAWRGEGCCDDPLCDA